MVFDSDASVEGFEVYVGAGAVVDVSAEGFANAAFDGYGEVCMDASVLGFCLDVGLEVWREGEGDFSVYCFCSNVFFGLFNNLNANFAIHGVGTHAAADLGETDFAIDGMCINRSVCSGHFYIAVDRFAFGSACGWLR